MFTLNPFFSICSNFFYFISKKPVDFLGFCFPFDDVFNIIFTVVLITLGREIIIIKKKINPDRSLKYCRQLYTFYIDTSFDVRVPIEIPNIYGGRTQGDLDRHNILGGRVVG